MSAPPPQIADAPQVEFVTTWCTTCGTQHTADEECPGALLAIGPESHGWRMLVTTKFGSEIYGVLIAPCRDCWRSRILTYPNILWISRGGVSRKFVGDSARSVERQAINHIKDHCKTKGIEMQKTLPHVTSGRVSPEQDPSAVNSDAVRAAHRRMHHMTVRYGIGRITDEAATDNLSEGGLFIRCDITWEIGTPLVMELNSRDLQLPLRGAVKWVRENEEPGRPAGMGVELIKPPPRYLHYVRQLEPESGVEQFKVVDDDGAPGPEEPLG